MDAYIATIEVTPDSRKMHYGMVEQSAFCSALELKLRWSACIRFELGATLGGVYEHAGLQLLH